MKRTILRIVILAIFASLTLFGNFTALAIEKYRLFDYDPFENYREGVVYKWPYQKGCEDTPKPCSNYREGVVYKWPYQKGCEVPKPRRDKACCAM